jgi:hypothetical protein
MLHFADASARFAGVVLEDYRHQGCPGQSWNLRACQEAAWNMAVSDSFLSPEVPSIRFQQPGKPRSMTRRLQLTVYWLHTDMKVMPRHAIEEVLPPLNNDLQICHFFLGSPLCGAEPLVCPCSWWWWWLSTFCTRAPHSLHLCAFFRSQ